MYPFIWLHFNSIIDIQTIEKSRIYEIIILSTLVFLTIGIAIVIYIITSKKNQITLYAQNLKQQQDSEATLLQTQIEIQEQTLQTISQEIHDNIGQILSLVKLNITQAIYTNEFNPTKLSNAETLLSKAIQDLRDISKSLNTDTINNIGFNEALQNEVDIINKSGLHISLDIEGITKTILPQSQLILFRIIQECLNNIVKHSQAKSCNIDMLYNQNNVEINIQDDGIGFNPHTIKKGQGLNNINKRSKLINATLQIESNQEKGTYIHILLPY